MSPAARTEDRIKTDRVAASGHGGGFLRLNLKGECARKRFLTLCLMLLGVFWALPGCGQENGAQADLVFVNDSDAAIVTVAVDFQGGNGGTQNADSSPLRRGESFGFEIGEYPVTVAVYDQIAGDFTQSGMLAQIVIPKAPPEGERWYVTARDSGSGLALSAGTEWPSGV